MTAPAPNPNRPPPRSELLDLARAEERRLVAGFQEVADEFTPFAGGAKCRAAPGAWSNAAVGAGLGEVPLTAEYAKAEVEALTAFYTSHGVEPRVEVCPYVDPVLLRALAANGYTVGAFENVLYRPLDGTPLPESQHPKTRVTIRAIDRTSEAEVELHARTAVMGFHTRGEPVPAGILDLARRVARHPRVTAIVAELNDQVVGAGGLESLGEVAALFGVSVLPHARRMGVQRAMIDWRLNHATKQGCRWATIGTRPGHITERNVLRVGFHVAYTKVILIRPGPGLTPVTE